MPSISHYVAVPVHQAGTARADGSPVAPRIGRMAGLTAETSEPLEVLGQHCLAHSTWPIPRYPGPSLHPSPPAGVPLRVRCRRRPLCGALVAQASAGGLRSDLASLGY